DLQGAYTGKGVVWLSVVSGKQTAKNYTTPTGDKPSKATAVLLDPEGTVGKKFGARTTPHMYIVSKTGDLVYQGAMDDQPSTDPESLMTRNNFVTAALDLTLKGQTVPKDKATTDPYGCSVKYAN